jgi:hypothetical protein
MFRPLGESRPPIKERDNSQPYHIKRQTMTAFPDFESCVRLAHEKNARPMYT